MADTKYEKIPLKDEEEDDLEPHEKLLEIEQSSSLAEERSASLEDDEIKSKEDNEEVEEDEEELTAAKLRLKCVSLSKKKLCLR